MRSQIPIARLTHVDSFRDHIIHKTKATKQGKRLVYIFATSEHDSLSDDVNETIKPGDVPLSSGSK